MTEARNYLIGAIILIVITTALAFLLTEEEPEGRSEPEDSVEETSGEEQRPGIEELVYGFLGTPYQRGPLGEGDEEEIYRTDVFDCTTLILVTAAKLNANGYTPEEMIKQVNYYPAGEVSYENRLHYSSYRNKVSPYFEDITAQVGGEKTQQKTVLLNKEQDDGERLIDIDWQQEITLDYLKKEQVPEVLSSLPREVGVAFLMEGDREIGLDVRHEGVVFEGEHLIHATDEHGEVFKEDLESFLEDSDYDGVIFFEIIDQN